MKPVLTALVGALAGYAWYRVVGCSTGSCPITARWWTATLYGAVMGAMMGSS
jgi:xanthosine utilization system XapX-like protein